MNNTGFGKAGGDVLFNNVHMKTEALDPEEEMPAHSPGPSSGRSTESDEPEIIETASNSRPRKRPAAGEPECIDLTNEEDHEELDEDMGSDYELDDDDLEEIKIEADDDLPELIEVEPVSKKELAEDRRKLGNDHFKKGEYNQALGMYTKAIELVPSEASYYGNRAACYMMLKKYQEAFSDTRVSLQLDPNYEKGYLRLVRTTLALGDVAACNSAITMVGQKGGLRLDLTEEKRKLVLLKQYLDEMESSKLKNDFRKILYLSERALEIAIGDGKLKIIKADALTKLGRYTEAGEVCTEVLQADVHCVEALCIRAVCLYQADNLDKCIQFLKQGLTFAPDNCRCLSLYRKIKHVKEQRESAASLYKSSKLAEAKLIYLECNKTVISEEFKNVSIESKLAFNLALISQKQGELEESIRYCNRAIELNPTYVKAFIHRANVHNSKELFEEAGRDFEVALKLDPTKRELKNEIQNAKMAAKKAKRKDYYKILHVDKNASDDDIRKAYKKRALMHHPDRHASAAEEVQKEQEKQFKDVGEAYEVLSDPKKRIRFDQGQDLTETSGGSYYDPYEANQIFNMFFSGGGVPTRGGGGGSRYHQFGRPAGGGGGGPYGYHR